MNPPKPFDILSQLAKYGLEQKVFLSDPKAILGFSSHVAREAERALADPALLHGQRVEAMFEALAVCLGEFTLLKREDTGSVFPKDEYIVPDFRVVLKDGEHWLVEVKNVYEEDPGKQERRLMSSAYRLKLSAYAAATGAQLKLAVFWARWGVWTLISPERLVDENGELTLNLFQAMKANELARLGDRSVGTKPPLRLRLVPDPEKTSPISEDGSVNFTIGNVKVYCGDDEIVDPVEREIAWIFMQHGEWEESGPTPIVDGEELLSLEFVWEPVERSNEGFEMIGSLSRMFARHFAEETVKGREVVQINAPLRPEWFESIVSDDYQSDNLPLWKFVLQPNFD
ncbi:hypothetical protein [Magnetospira sp. QH-2]|uniref:hypothetical protein n=1 Tax=Magnetospira sp. (strain QH-2) TaxID=1288970 RepID=UPI0003E80DE1|nr:hypothetical protein [Magnetospira sp. QH-2]CCQ74244.1 Protein of unknown function [Magnetospira sp. QH-2]